MHCSMFRRFVISRTRSFLNAIITLHRVQCFLNFVCHVLSVFLYERAMCSHGKWPLKVNNFIALFFLSLNNKMIHWSFRQAQS